MKLELNLRQTKGETGNSILRCSVLEMHLYLSSRQHAVKVTSRIFCYVFKMLQCYCSSYIFLLNKLLVLFCSVLLR